MEFKNSRPKDYNGIVHCIYKGFPHHFKPLKANERSIKNMLLKIIKLDQFKIAVDNDRVIACCGVGKGGNRLYKKNRRVFYEEFGFIKGLIAERVVRHILGKAYEVDSTCGYLEFVTILDEYRRQGIMTGLLCWTFEQGEYSSFMLDVASNNHKAIKLYEKLGFIEAHRIKEKFPKQAGFDHSIIMRR